MNVGISETQGNNTELGSTAQQQHRNKDGHQREGRCEVALKKPAKATGGRLMAD
jgi:hypothetical protein